MRNCPHGNIMKHSKDDEIRQKFKDRGARKREKSGVRGRGKGQDSPFV